MFRIFIGWDFRFPEPADVLANSLRKHSSIELDIRYLKLPELRLNRGYDPLASTEYTYSRFLCRICVTIRATLSISIAICSVWPTLPKSPSSI